MPPAAYAQSTLHWDINGNTAGLGGTGTWDTANTFWNTSATGTSGTVSAWNNGTVDNAIFGGTAGTVTLGTPITAGNLSFATTGYTLTGSTLTLAGPTPTITTNAGISATISSILAGTNSLTKAGTGTLTLSGVNTFTGGTTISIGTLRTASSAGAGTGTVTLGDAATGSNNVAWRIAGSSSPLNNIVVSSSGTGTVTLGGYSGGIFTIYRGNVQLGRDIIVQDDTGDRTSFTGIISGAGNITISGSRVSFDNNANTATGVITINPGSILQLNANTGVRSNASIVNNGTLRLVSGSGTVAPTPVIQGLNGSGGITSLTPGATNLSVGFNDASGSFSGVIFNGSSAVSLTKIGAGTQVLSGANVYTGTTTVSGGTLQVGNGGTTGTLGTGAISNNASLVFNRSNTLTVANAISGTGSLTQAGAGTTILTNANSYTGVTAINQGTLRAGSTSAFGNNSAVTLANVAGATLDLNGFNHSIGSLAGGGSTGGNVTLGSATLTTGGNNTSTTHGGVISGTGALVKTGTGTQTLTGNNTFTGITSVAAGALAVNGRLCGTLNVQSGGKLQGTGTVCDTTNFTGGTVAPGNSIGTLTINGNYTGNGGVLEMETVLSGTGSPADRLLITGNATGTTEIRSINLGGSGAATGTGNTDGVSIIQVGGASTASTFQLQGGYAAAGPYQYRLNFFAPGASAAAQADPLLGTAVFGDYRLQSAVDASGAPIPVPQIAGYQAMPSGALRYGSSLLNGLHQRLGDIRRLSWAGTEQDAPREEFFLRGNTSRTEFSGDRGPSFDQDMQFVQAGGNFAKWDMGDTGATLRLGGALSYGNSDLTVKGSSARVDLKGMTLAMMATYRGASGEYLDVVGQGTRYRSEVRTLERGNTGSPKGWGWGLSVEGGYPLKMGDGLIVEPQAQLSYQKVKFDRFTDVDNITVDLENSASLRGRAGVRLQRAADEGQQWLPFMEVDLLHEFLEGSTVNASGVGFGSDLGGTSVQLAAGVNGRLSRNATFFLTLGYEKGVSKASADTLSGNVGVRMSF